MIDFFFKTDFVVSLRTGITTSLHGTDVEKSKGQWRQPFCSVLAFHDDGEWHYLSLWRSVYAYTSIKSASFTGFLFFVFVVFVYIFNFYFVLQDLLVIQRAIAPAIRLPPATICTSSHGLGVSKRNKKKS